MALFMTRKRREKIGDEMDDLLMRQYHHRCKLDEAQKSGNKELVMQEEKKIEQEEQEIRKLRKKLG